MYVYICLRCECGAYVNCKHVSTRPQKPSEGQTITGKNLCLHQQLNIQEQFNASQGWLQRFKSWHGVHHLNPLNANVAKTQHHLCLFF